MTFKLRTNVAGVYAVASEVCPKSLRRNIVGGDDGWVAARNDGASITVAPGAPSASASVVAADLRVRRTRRRRAR